MASKPSRRNEGPSEMPREGTSTRSFPPCATRLPPRTTRSGRTSSSAAKVTRSARKPGAIGSAVAEAVVPRARPRREAEREDRVEAHRDGAPDVVVDVAVGEEVPRVAVVRGEGEALGVRRGDEREEVVEVLGGGPLADPDRHAAPHLLGRLVAAEALVVGPDAGADVGVQVEAGEERRVAVDGKPAGDGVLDLGADAGVAEEEAGDVHHLGEAEDVLPAVEAGEVVGAERRAGRLEVRRRDARREHDVDLDGEVRRGGEERLEPLGAADVRDLVRVGDDGGRAVRRRRGARRREASSSSTRCGCGRPRRRARGRPPSGRSRPRGGPRGTGRSRGSGLPRRRPSPRGSRPSGR